MKNIEIKSIVNAYTSRKTENAKARKDGKEFREIVLPAPIAWKQRLNMDDLFRATKIIDDALQEASSSFLDDEHSTPTDGDGRQIKPEFVQAFMDAQNEILEQETDVKIRKIKIEDLGTLGLSDSDLDILAFMIEEGGD